MATHESALIHLSDKLANLLDRQLTQINQKLEKLNMTQDEAKKAIDDILAKQTALGAALSEASTELVGKIATLQSTIDQLQAGATSNPVSPDLQASIDSAVAQMSALAAQGQALADIVPNPTPVHAEPAPSV